MRHRRTFHDLQPVLYELFLGGRQVESGRLEATDYSIADQLWMITSRSNKCDGPRTGAIELRSVVSRVPYKRDTYKCAMTVLEASRSSPSIFRALRRPSGESALSLSASRLPSWPTTRHGHGRPNTAPICFACQVYHAQSFAPPPRRCSLGQWRRRKAGTVTILVARQRLT